MLDQPKKWVAALLSIFAPPIGMMYVAQIRWAGIYLLLALAIGVVGEFYVRDPVIAGAMQLLFAQRVMRAESCRMVSFHSTSLARQHPIGGHCDCSNF